MPTDASAGRREVDAHLATLDHPMASALVELCRVVREVDPRIEESIKWNSPSFAIVDHFATTGLDRRGTLRLVLHTGAKKRTDAAGVAVDDPTGLLLWKEPDRAVVTFSAEHEVDAARESLQAILRDWIDQTQYRFDTVSAAATTRERGSRVER